MRQFDNNYNEEEEDDDEVGTDLFAEDALAYMLEKRMDREDSGMAGV